MLKNAIALLSTAVLLVLGILFSVVLLAAVVVLGVAAWAYLWWRTRKLRSVMQQQAETTAYQSQSAGHIIEGEAVVVEERPALTEPAAPTDATRPPAA